MNWCLKRQTTSSGKKSTSNDRLIKDSNAKYIIMDYVTNNAGKFLAGISENGYKD